MEFEICPKMIQSYLENRQQYVTYNGETSNTQKN